MSVFFSRIFQIQFKNPKSVFLKVIMPTLKDTRQSSKMGAELATFMIDYQNDRYFDENDSCITEMTDIFDKDLIA